MVYSLGEVQVTCGESFLTPPPPPPTWISESANCGLDLGGILKGMLFVALFCVVLFQSPTIALPKAPSYSSASTSYGTHVGASADSVLSVSHQSARADCLDCNYSHEQDPPQVPGHPYIYYFGEWDCEDGYSPHGPCIICGGITGLDCETEGYIASDDPDLCNNYWCLATPQYSPTLDLLAAARYSDVLTLLDSEKLHVRWNSAESKLEFLSCAGNTVRSIDLGKEHPFTAIMRARPQSRIR